MCLRNTVTRLTLHFAAGPGILIPLLLGMGRGGGGVLRFTLVLH